MATSSPDPVNSQSPVPPDALRPWYFREWFLVPTFVWWPCSAILFIRSPWHNGWVVGALSWAWIITGGGWIFLRLQWRLQNGQSLFDPTLLALAAPGVALTILTQSLWLRRDRPRIRRIRDAGGFRDYSDLDQISPSASSRGRAGGESRPRRRRLR